MQKNKNIMELFRDNKTVVMILAICLFLIELEVFALAVMKSGRKSRLHVLNAAEEVIYETDGNSLSSFDKYYFEKTFGPFENYNVKLVTTEQPFPFRAWFSAAVGIPIGLVLLMAFVLKAFSTIFYEGKQDPEVSLPLSGEETRLERIILRISRFNIFMIGFIVFLLIFSYWVIPNFLSYAGVKGMEAITRYKWIVLGGIAVCLFLFMWIVYLKYLLAKKSLEAKTEIEKYRLELEYGSSGHQVMKLEYHGKDHEDAKRIELERKH
ncbi:MAG: hypothetical protein ABIK15_15710 [Pseudomonadota bacterium]